MPAEVDLKGAIVKYLKNEWSDSEKKALRDIRYNIAKDMVPKALGASKKEVSISIMEEYIKVLTDEPDSEKGLIARKFLDSLTRPTPGDYGSLVEIEKAAKLRYINDTFLKGLGKIKFGELTWGEGDVSFDERGVQIGVSVNSKIKLLGRKPLDLIPDPKEMYAWPFSFYWDTYVGEEDSIIKIESNQTEEDISKMLLEKFKQMMRGRLDEVKAPTKGEIFYKAVFEEGTLEHTLYLTKFSPRVLTILDNVLKPLG